MIAAELAPADDRTPIIAFFKRELEALGYAQHRFTQDEMPSEEAIGTRWMTLQEDGEITAALGLWPTTPDVSYVVPYLVVAGDHPDKVKALDALVLWGSNQLAGEGVKLIYTLEAPAGDDPRAGSAWATVHSGLKIDPLTLDSGARTGTPQDLIDAILTRRPEWRTSLSFTT